MVRVFRFVGVGLKPTPTDVEPVTTKYEPTPTNINNTGIPMSSGIFNQYTGYHNRRSIRLPGYNYSSIGYYFVTICIQNPKQKLFGDVVDGKMVENEYGGIVRACWHDLPNHYANVVLDEFIIMPDHIHGIIRLVDRRGTAANMGAGVSVGAGFVGAGLKPAPTNAEPDMTNITHGNAEPVTTTPKRHGLSEIVRAFKTFSSRKINKIGQSFQWQRNYYEHIIRNDKSLFIIRKYIRKNPLQWTIDKIKHDRYMSVTT